MFSCVSRQKCQFLTKKITHFLISGRIKIIPNEDSLGLILKKTFPSMIFHEKKESDLYHLYYFLLTHSRLVQKFEKFGKIPEIAEDHNFGTEYAKNVEFVSKYAVLDTLPRILLITQFRPNVDLGPIGNQLCKF